MYDKKTSGEEIVEISLAWGDGVLSLTPLGKRRAFWLGESRDDGAPSDLFLPEEIVGGARHRLLQVDDLGTVRLCAPPTARGWLRTRDSLQVDIHSAPEHFLLPGSRAQLQMGDFVVVVRSVGRAARVPKGLAASEWRAPLGYFASTAALFAGLLGGLAFFVPPLGLEEDTGVDRERLVLLRQYMAAAAVREQARPEPEPGRAEATPSGAAAGQAAAGASGSLGKTTPTESRGRFAVRESEAREDVNLARERAREEARSWGMVGLLSAAPLGDLGPSAPWGAETASGHDALAAEGSMWADELGDAPGGGLGLGGLGEGGGGVGRGVGLTDIGGGIGPGTGGAGRWGTSRGLGDGTHTTRVPPVRSAGDTVVSGHLPAEVIQRTVRQNFGRFRMCYQGGLSRNPSLEGRVAVRFVIDRRGAVSNVGLAGAGLADAAVNDCLKLAFYGLSFTPPENGIVQVTYPLLFSPE